MSRNLSSTGCQFCEDKPTLDEAPRAIRIEDTGPHYFKEYEGMMVANATCPSCEAKYLAWVTPPRQWHQQRTDDRPYVDLSFRDSFNDEPAEADLPVYQVEKVLRRVGPAKTRWHEMYAAWREEKRLAELSDHEREFGRAAPSGEDLT